MTSKKRLVSPTILSSPHHRVWSSINGEVDDLPYHYSIKVVLLGDSAAGKTTLLRCYTQQMESWSEGSAPTSLPMCRETLGGCMTKCIEHVERLLADEEMWSQSSSLDLDDTSKLNGTFLERVELRCWDTPGAVDHQHLAPSTCRSAAVVLLVFSVTDRQTYLGVGEWATAAKSFAPPNCVFALVANSVEPETCEVRSSLFSLRTTPEVTMEEAASFAEANNFLFYECNARTGRGVKNIFCSLSQHVLRLVDAGDIDVSHVDGGVLLHEQLRINAEEKEGDCCCCC